MIQLPADRPAVMGVLNVTPDSFSDGGAFLAPSAAVDHAVEMIAEGADLIDIGGESTRPGAAPVPEDEEARRTLPVVEAVSRAGITVSIDTSKPSVAEAAVGAGASMINDVTGFRDPDMRRLAGNLGVGVCVMHMQGEPRTMQFAPRYEDVAAEVAEFLTTQASLLIEDGVAPGSIWIDPGIGFGKSLDDNVALLRAIPSLTSLGYPVLIGVSRKSFIDKIASAPDASNRIGGSLAAGLYAVAQGARILRVHDVRATVQALAVWRSLA